MLLVIAYDLCQSLEILGNAARLLADRAIAGFRVNQEVLTRALERNPILVTALNAVIGYEKGAEIAKKAYQEGRPVRDVARELTGLSEAELARLLDPAELTKGGYGRTRKCSKTSKHSGSTRSTPAGAVKLRRVLPFEHLPRAPCWLAARAEGTHRRYPELVLPRFHPDQERRGARSFASAV